MPLENDTKFTIDPELKFVSQASMDILAYWEAKRGKRPFPTRKDISPREIAHLLPWLHMCDVLDAQPSAEDVLVSNSAFRIRLLGTALAEVLGRDVGPGTVFSDKDQEIWRRRSYLGLQSAFQTRKPSRMSTIATAFPGKEFRGSEVCLLPLSSNGIDIDIILGITSLLVKPG